MGVWSEQFWLLDGYSRENKIFLNKTIFLVVASGKILFKWNLMTKSFDHSKYFIFLLSDVLSKEKVLNLDLISHQK